MELEMQIEDLIIFKSFWLIVMMEVNKNFIVEGVLR